MKKGSLVLFCVLGFLLVSVHSAYSQSNFHENSSGKRKKEKKNQRISKSHSRGTLFKRKASAGNADAFASNSVSHRGFFRKLFHGNGMGAPKNASLRKTKPGRVQNREQKRLFGRIATGHKREHEKIQSRNRKERARRRAQGSSFSNR